MNITKLQQKSVLQKIAKCRTKSQQSRTKVAQIIFVRP